MSDKKRISICIPVFNEAANLPIAVATVDKLFAEQLPAYELELIVTDNGSTDATWELVQSLAKERPNLKGYRFSRNFGYQNSVFTGISMATGDAVIELDADLEDPPAVIPQFVRLWEQGYDVAYGVRRTRSGPRWLVFLFSIFYWVLRRMSDLDIPANSGDFRLLDRKVVEVIKSLPERNLYLRGLVSYAGFKQAAVLYDRDPRLSGTSKFRFIHYVTLAVDALTAFSKTPLRLIGVLGVLLFLGSLLAIAYYIFGYFMWGSALPGFTTLIVIILFLQSITYIFLGVLGEYLSRIFDDAKFRPRVIITEAVNAQDFPRWL